MKHTLILLALCALFASCNNGGDCAQLKKENDSLRNLLSNGPGSSSMAMVGSPAGGGNPVNINDTCLIDTSEAIIRILAFDSIVHAKNIVKWDTCAFVINMSDIDSIQKYYPSKAGQTECTALLIYPAADRSGKLTIVYSPLSGTKGNYQVLYPTATPQGQAQLFDHTLPCPDCGITGALGHIFVGGNTKKVGK